MIKLFLPIVLLASVVTLYANDSEPGKATLSQQFQAVLNQAEVIESFRMLRAYQVENFWKSVQDTLRQKDEALTEIKVRIPAVESEIESLRTTLQKKDQAVADMEHAGSHITWLGWDISKTSFIRGAVIIVLVLLALMGLALWAFKMSHQNAFESRSLYDDVCREFDSYKHKMVEKEVKLLRELQDYRNRMVELKSA